MGTSKGHGFNCQALGLAGEVVFVPDCCFGATPRCCTRLDCYGCLWNCAMGSKLGFVLVQVGHQAKTGIEFVFAFGALRAEASWKIFFGSSGQVGHHRRQQNPMNEAKSKTRLVDQICD